MISENIISSLSGTNVLKIKKILRENEKESYDFLKGHFCFLPSKYCINNINIDESPVEAIANIVNEVDGSKGMKTSYTPEAVIILYKHLWSNMLYTKEPVKLKGRKPLIGVENYLYEMEWKADINGMVSGDILNSFPKKATIDILYPNIQEIPYQLKQFARLCYTLGNLMPVPKNGTGKKSINSIHSYFKCGEGYYERFDYFLHDILNYKNNYEDFREYIKMNFVENNYLMDYIGIDKKRYMIWQLTMKKILMLIILQSYQKKI